MNFFVRASVRASCEGGVNSENFHIFIKKCGTFGTFHKMLDGRLPDVICTSQAKACSAFRTSQSPRARIGQSPDRELCPKGHNT